MRVQFRGAASKIYGADVWCQRKQIQKTINRFSLHDLCSLWAGPDVTVETGLVAEPSEVDLQRLRLPSRKLYAMPSECICEGIDGSFHPKLHLSNPPFPHFLKGGVPFFPL